MIKKYFKKKEDKPVSRSNYYKYKKDNSRKYYKSRNTKRVIRTVRSNVRGQFKGQYTGITSQAFHNRSQLLNQKHFSAYERQEQLRRNFQI